MAETLFATAFPSGPALNRLRRRLALPGGSADVYLAYAREPLLSLAGFLVTGNGGVDEVIAYCPLPSEVEQVDGAWTDATLRQLDIARCIALRPETAKESPAVYLGYAATGRRDVPPWVYGLACIPVTRDWDGQLLYPRPFCPKMFERMARQPAATHWLRDRYPTSPLRAAGGVDGAPAATGREGGPLGG
jgi:hypothetical protein